MHYLQETILVTGQTTLGCLIMVTRM